MIVGSICASGVDACSSDCLVSALFGCGAAAMARVGVGVSVDLASESAATAGVGEERETVATVGAAGATVAASGV